MQIGKKLFLFLRSVGFFENLNLILKRQHRHWSCCPLPMDDCFCYYCKINLVFLRQYRHSWSCRLLPVDDCFCYFYKNRACFRDNTDTVPIFCNPLFCCCCYFSQKTLILKRQHRHWSCHPLPVDDCFCYYNKINLVF